MYGTPVLGANIGGIPELIRVGETGELFESGNCEELEREITALWERSWNADAFREMQFYTMGEYCAALLRLESK